ncbi:protein sprouty-like proiein [Sarotherodon galilaeus]
MPEAEVVYSDVKFTRGKKGASEAVTPSTDSTYSEIKISKTQPSTAQLSEGPQPAVVSKGSKVTSERVVLVVLSVLLAAALIALCFTIQRKWRNRIASAQSTKNHIHSKSVSFLETNPLKKDKPISKSSTSATDAVGLSNTLQKTVNCMHAYNTQINLVAGLSEGPSDPCYKCEEGWELHGGKCYYFSVNKSSWEQSRDECGAKEGDLVKIDSREEQTFLQRRLRAVMTEAEDKFWIGLTDSAVEGRWVWADGSPLDQSLKFWSGNEPDNWKGHNGEYPDGQDCVRMGEKGSTDDLNCWFDAFCSKPHRSICEKAAVKGQFKKICD